MSRFIEELGAFAREHWDGAIRVAAARGDGPVESLDLRPASLCLNVYSVAKTFTMTALGLLYDQGLIDPQDRLCDILSDELPPRGMDERWRGVTLDMLLRHRAGMPAGFLDIDVTDPRTFTDDYLGYALTQPLAYAPDTEARYSDGAYYLLARAVEKRAGMALDTFLWREALTALSFRELAASRDPRGHVIGATGMYMGAADMVRLGQVYLGGGTYQGRQILSRAWVDTALSRGYALDRTAGGRAYAKGGMYGQMLIIAPDSGRVAAVQAFGHGGGPIAEFVAGYGDGD